MTDLADADDPASDVTEHQLHQFHGLIEALEATDLTIPYEVLCDLCAHAHRVYEPISLAPEQT